MKDRTITTVTAIFALTVLAATAIAVGRDVAVLAPTTTAVLALMGYEGRQRIRDSSSSD